MPLLNNFNLGTVSSMLPAVKISFQHRLNLYILFTFSGTLLFILSLFGMAGPFGDVVGNFFRTLFGRGAILVVIGFFVTGLILIRIQTKKTVGNIVSGQFLTSIFLIWLSVQGFLSVGFGITNIKDVDLVGGGGLVGYILYPFLLKPLGLAGAIVILIAILLYGIILFTGKTIVECLEILGSLSKKPELIWELIPDAFETFRMAPGAQTYAESIIDSLHNKTELTKEIPKIEIEPETKLEDTIKKEEEASTQVFSDDELINALKTLDQATSPEPVIDTQLVDSILTTKQIAKTPKLKTQKTNFTQDTIFRRTGDWQELPINIFIPSSTKKGVEPTQFNQSKIQETFRAFNINVSMGQAITGPTVSQYQFRPDSGIKLSRISALHQDLSLALAAKSLRMQMPIPGQNWASIEIPNQFKQEVRVRDLIDTNEFDSYSDPLPIPIGKTVSGENLFYSLTKAPHLLVAGATGSGKSVWINSMLTSLLFKYSPKDLQLILIDMKMVELNLYDNIPHLLSPVITESDKAINALKWSIFEMDRRYQLLRGQGKRNILDYNNYVESQSSNTEGLNLIPYIVIVIDELAELMMQAKNEVEPIIARLTAMSRAVGIHLVLGTQRPDVNIVTGLIKTNVPTRLCFAVATQIDSRVILDSNGGETLLGQGDGLFKSPKTLQPIRFQGANTEEIEVHRLVKQLIDQGNQKEGYSNFNPDVTEPPVGTINVPGLKKSTKDPEDGIAIYEDAKKLVLDMQMCSISILSGNLGIDSKTAKKVIDELYDNGVVGGEIYGTNSREVIQFN